MSLRICIGGNHQPDCPHRDYMRQGVEEFLASDDVRDAIHAWHLDPATYSGEQKVESMVAHLAHALYVREGRRLR